MNLKVLLVDLGSHRKEFNEPIGIECIETYVTRRLGNIFFDSDIYPNFDKNKIADYDILGISLNVGTLDIFDDIYNFIKKNNLNIPIIVGNTIPTYGFKELLEKYNDILCVRGEGEEAFLQLINLFLKEKNFTPSKLKNIHNISFWEKGGVFCNKIVPINLEKESKLIRKKKFINLIKSNNGIARIEGSRGCHWGKCHFCCINAKYGNSSWRAYNVEKIIAELIDLSKEGISSLYFTDEDFFGQNYNRIVELSEQILYCKSKNIIAKDINFFISILTNDVVNSNGYLALKKFKEAGLREVFIGLESGESEQIRRYNKKANIDNNKLALTKLKELDIQVDIGFIFFDPYLKFDALYKNMEYLDSIESDKYDSSSFKRLRIQPYTQAVDDYKDAITAGLDLNNLEYPYKFIDHNVESTYKMFSEWELLLTDEIYFLQGRSRGEINSESDREKIKEIIAKIRTFDFDMLKNIVHFVNGDITNKEYLNKKNVLLNKKRKIIFAAQNI